MARLAGKVAFITGGGGGIGRATAERFAEEGAKVVIAEIDQTTGPAAAQSARARSGNSGGDALFVHCDVRDQTSVEAAFAETIKRFGRVDILHNNAGGSTAQDGPVTTAPIDEFWRAHHARFVRHIPVLQDRHSLHREIRWRLDHQHVLDRRLAGAAGARLLHSGQRGDRGADALDGGRICAAKDQGQRHCARRRAVGAGQEAAANAKDIEALAATHLLGLGLPIHIADMAVYLASDEAAITTGQVLSVDSGVSIR